MGPVRSGSYRRSSSGSIRGVKSEALDDVVLRASSDDLRCALAVLEESDRGDAHDPVFRSYSGCLIDVELYDSDLRSVLVLDLFELGMNQPARTAPFRPEVDDHGGLRRQDDLIEVLLGHGLHLGHASPPSEVLTTHNPSAPTPISRPR